MKKTFILAAALVIGLGFTACKQQTKEATPATNDSMQVAADSATTDSVKAHEVPAYQTTIYYDANNDNLNVVISQNDKDKTYVEKDTIKVTDALKSK